MAVERKPVAERRLVLIATVAVLRYVDNKAFLVKFRLRQRVMSAMAKVL